jgi:hypothetical protein
MSQWRVDLEAFELVLVRRPENAPAYADGVLHASTMSIWPITPGCARSAT